MDCPFPKTCAQAGVIPQRGVTFLLLLNTSFNIQEPIVCTPDDAINTFLRSKVDYLVLGNHVIKRET